MPIPHEIDPVDQIYNGFGQTQADCSILGLHFFHEMRLFSERNQAIFEGFMRAVRKRRALSWHTWLAFALSDPRRSVLGPQMVGPRQMSQHC